MTAPAEPRASLDDIRTWHRAAMIGAELARTGYPIHWLGTTLTIDPDPAAAARALATAASCRRVLRDRKAELEAS